MEKRPAIFWSLLLFVVLLASFGAICWAMNWLWLTPWWQPTLQAAVLILVSGLFSLALYKFLRREKPDPEQVKVYQWRERGISSRFNLIWHKHTKLASNPYLVPWYIQLEERSAQQSSWLAQMGFELVETTESEPDDEYVFRFWVSESCVLVTLDLTKPEADRQQGLEILYRLLNQKRPRQALNGVICAVSLGKLVNSTELSVNELSLKYRNTLSDLNAKTGLTIPSYCVFAEMAGIKDFCELFSTLEEAKRDQPFGSLKPQGVTTGYDRDWFNQSFDQLVANLSSSTSETLQQQLNEEYRSSSVAGLYQLQALRYELEDFLSLTFSEHQFDEVALNLRGYFFVNAGGQVTSTDVMTMINASDLGLSRLSAQTVVANSPSLFGKNLIRNCIVKESALVGVHKTKEWQYRYSRLAISFGLLALFGSLIYLFKLNFEHQQALDNKAIAQLELYKEHLKNDPIIPDDLSSPVFSLAELRRIHMLYAQDQKPWYIIEWLPNSSIEQYVHQAYHTELSTVLLDLMRDYISKDMFVYNSLDDKVKMLELLNYHQLLYNPNRAHVKPLVDYYLDSLKEEGEGDIDTLKNFELLARDVLSTGAVPPESDPELLALVRSSLSSEDMSELLYQHILQHPQFARRVDFREKLPSNYQALFTFKDGFSGYLIPYVFTKQGFEELYNETGLQLATEATQSYEGVMGRINGEAEMNRINRQLRQRYVQEYIQYWQALSTSIDWVGVTDWGTSQLQLEQVVDPVFSPLLRFYTLIDQNTYLVTAPAAADQAASAAASSQQDAAASNTKETVVSSIAAPFTSLHNLLAQTDVGQSRFDVAMTQIRTTKEWVEKSKQASSRGAYFLEQSKNSDSSNPIAQLERLANDYSDPILPAMMQGHAQLLNKLASHAMLAEINQDWSQVVSFYRERIAGRYPFDKSAQFDATITDVEAFFVKGGKVDQFAAKYAPYFESVAPSETLLRGFIHDDFTRLSPLYQQFIDKTAQLQDSVFTDGKLGFEFLVKAQKMSPDLTRFAFEAGTRLFEYQNGPTLWRKQSWPIPANQPQDILIVTKDTSGGDTRDKVEGVWSWFRIADKMQSATLVGSEEISWRYLNAEQEILLRVKSKSVSQAFTPGLFEQLKLPVQL
ncbi:type VI secretion protein IcmF/TssM N-terminal domain-containing protein [Vibrio sp. SCSIO 43136]|uniref:type VI secretion protein IcmF/TssM N-terminal domain-containing protein n=1 Tax=Vibrio sp. SCSIO 43136 TaxID=2819101 RepID=UPI0020761DC4|nr:type VI secretion protein IcmF/TssM N-terminal domain-containing protein [Vibrio sp. SCSIO 43136]USD66352.1 type VI secretion system membrane subunit TssM [Vibrio sp. SCSIO 43136]